ncbi:MAG: T9SS type A sorting domain-containing protein [Ignavibacteria bacterium]|nr:T9SS type A sorting domain-containing protein [Ignavibacteria bacterium]
MKKKFIYIGTLVSVAALFFLGFVISENPKNILTRTGDGNVIQISTPGVSVDAATFSESFEGTTFPPAGWLKLSEVGNTTGSWDRFTVGQQLPGWNPGFGIVTQCPGGGSAVAGVTYGTVSSNNREWLMTPQITNVQSGDSLKFYLRYMLPGYSDSVSVFISTTTQTVAAMTIPVMRKFFPAGGDTTYQEYKFRLGDFVANGSNIYIGFKESIVDNATNGSGFALDLVRVSGTSAPPNPTTWYEQTSGLTTQLTSVSAPDINNVWICGYAGKVLRTTNGGTWASASGNLGTSDLYSIYAFDANNALVTSSPGGTFVYRTSNGGTNWTQVFTDANASAFVDSWYFKDANNGLMVADAYGGRSKIYKTTNAGLNWDSTGVNFNTTATSYNNSIWGNGNTVYWGTNASTVFRSTNFGTTWTTLTATGNTNTEAFWFNDANNGFIGGTILQQTTNGGTTLTTNTGAGTGTYTGLVGTTAGNYWFARGTNIYSTTNNGTSWTAATTVTGTYNHMTISRSGSPYIYAVRNNGGISKYGGSFTGVTPVTTVADNYSLSQNYPNPFNPTTNIKFAIPQSGFVTLKIYNMLGKEVATLVSSNLSKGSYSYDFNASNLASGVYFYKLETANFSEVKKMSLIK